MPVEVLPPDELNADTATNILNKTAPIDLPEKKRLRRSSSKKKKKKAFGQAPFEGTLQSRNESSPQKIDLKKAATETRILGEEDQARAELMATAQSNLSLSPPPTQPKKARAVTRDMKKRPQLEVERETKLGTRNASMAEIQIHEEENKDKEKSEAEDAK